jgi:hypothetical protein
MRQLTIAATVALAVVAAATAANRLTAAGPHATADAPASSVARTACGPSCRSAYAAIARALPHDRANMLAHAILGTPGFDYLQLARALRIPTVAEIRAQWRRRCQARFPRDPGKARACYRLILGRPPVALPAV